MQPRLPWQRYPEVSGFIARPDGVPHRYAAIWPESGARHGSWRWLVRIDPPDKGPADFESGIFRNGIEAERQAAADAATEAWPSVVAGAKASGLI